MLKIKPKWCLKQNQTSVWNTYSRTRHQSGTLIAQPDTCLENCLDSNNTFTNYSSGHPFLWVTSHPPLPVIIHFHLILTIFYLIPLPSSTGCHKCMAPTFEFFNIQSLMQNKKHLHLWQKLVYLGIFGLGFLLKSAPSNLSNCKVLCYNWNQGLRICLIAKSSAK